MLAALVSALALVETAILAALGMRVVVERRRAPLVREHALRSVSVESGPSNGPRATSRPCGLSVSNGEMLELLIENTLEGLALIGPDRRFRRVNAATVRFTGRGERELVGLPLEELIAGDAAAQVRECLERALAGAGAECETALVRKDGRVTRVALRLVPVAAATGVEGVLCFVEESTEERALKHSEHRQRERLRALYDLAASFTIDMDEQIRRALRFACDSLAMDAAMVNAVEGGTLRVLYGVGEYAYAEGLVVPLDRSYSRYIFGARTALRIADVAQSPLRGDIAERWQPWRSFIGTTISSGGVPLGTLTIAGIRPREPDFDDADEDFVNLAAALIGSALERQHHERSLGELAYTDPLTRLPNRRLLADRFRQILARAKRDGSCAAVVYLDLDGFKEVNDLHGHAAGDEVLRAVGERLEGLARESDTLARVGGDEFIAVLAATDADGAAHFAERVLAALRVPPALRSDAPALTASIGIACYPDDGEEPDVLLRAADTAMYTVKRSGKNGYAFARKAGVAAG